MASSASWQKIYSNLQYDPRFLALSRNAQLCYFLTFTHTNMNQLGAMRASPAGLAADFGGTWTEAEVRSALEEMATVKLIDWDPEARFLAFTDYMDHHAAKDPNAMKSWERAFNSLPDCAAKRRLAGKGERNLNQRCLKGGKDLPARLFATFAKGRVGKKLNWAQASETPSERRSGRDGTAFASSASTPASTPASTAAAAPRESGAALSHPEVEVLLAQEPGDQEARQTWWNALTPAQQGAVATLQIEHSETQETEDLGTAVRRIRRLLLSARDRVTIIGDASVIWSEWEITNLPGILDTVEELLESGKSKRDITMGLLTQIMAATRKIEQAEEH